MFRQVGQFYSAVYTPEPRIEWEIPGPYQGDTFVVLSTGGFEDVPDGAVISSKISQEVFLHAGDTIIGAYFFGTTDYSPFNDYASIYLELAGDPNDYPGSVEHFLIPDAQCDIETIESFRSTLELSPETGGWITFSHTVEANQVGPYFLRCEVTDFKDSIYNSYFAIDGLQSGGDAAGLGSIHERPCEMGHVTVDRGCRGSGWHLHLVGRLGSGRLHRRAARRDHDRRLPDDRRRGDQ